MPQKRSPPRLRIQLAVPQKDYNKPGMPSPDMNHRQPPQPQPSPHLVRDRITNSPAGPYADIEIIPKTTQAYRTSFSAVTMPHRMQRRLQEQVKSQPTLAGVGSLGCESPTVGNRLRNNCDSSTGVNEVERVVKNDHNASRGRSLSRTQGTSGNSGVVDNPCSPGSSLDDRISQVSEPSPYRSTSTPGGSSLGDTDVSSFMHGSSPEEIVVNGRISTDIDVTDSVGAGKPKQVIEVVYSHTQVISYAQLVNMDLPLANSKTKQSAVEFLKLCGRSHSEDILNRQCSDNFSNPKPLTLMSLPEQAKAGSTNSLLNYFKRFSPKSFRNRRSRSLGPEQTRKLSNKSSTSDISNVHVVNVDMKDKVKPAQSSSRIGRLLKRQKEESTPSMSTSSVRMLKSIHDTNSDVYHAFKQKRSPNQLREAATMKQQPLKTVEFDEIDRKVSESKSQKVMPPCSLQIRNIQSLNRSKFLPSISADSIGQCSLDVNAIGSEPSLTSHKSQASKNTLHSHEVPTESSTDDVDNHVKSHYVTSRILTLEGSTKDIDPSKLKKHISSKEPSYLNISRSVSGYTRNNSQKQELESKKDSIVANGDIVHDINKSDVVQNGHVDILQNSYISDSQTEIDISHECPKIIQNGLHSDLDLAPRDETADFSGFQQVSLVAPESQSNGVPRKNGAHFLRIVNRQEQRLLVAIENLQNVLETTSDIPDEPCGMIRATLGKCNLLVQNKFVHYREFCNKNLHPDPAEPLCTTDEDLAGLWDIVTLQIDDVDAMFDEVNTLRQNNWKSPMVKDEMPVSSPSRIKVAKKTKNTAKDSATKAREEMRNKAREEAKKRLMAAKRAGRERKASQNDDVEIYVPS